jgi:hypothetical protein
MPAHRRAWLCSSSQERRPQASKKQFADTFARSMRAVAWNLLVRLLIGGDQTQVDAVTRFIENGG